MSNHNFEFETTADSQGNILVEEEFEIPISVTIEDLSVKTTSNCNSRSHNVTISIDDNNIIANGVNDCIEFSIDLDLSISSGLRRIKLFCDGFDQNEIVNGKENVNYNISLFPFGLTDSTQEHIINLDDPRINSTRQIIKNKINQLPNITITSVR